MYLVIFILVILFILFTSNNSKNYPKKTRELKKSSEIKNSPLTKTYDDKYFELLEKENQLKMKYFSALAFGRYSEEKAISSLKGVKKLYEHDKLMHKYAKKTSTDLAIIDDTITYNMANCYITLKMYDEAEKIFKYAFSEIPEKGQHNIGKVYFYYIRSFFVEGKIKEALTSIKKLSYYNNFEKYIYDLAKSLSKEMSLKEVQEQLKSFSKENKKNEIIDRLLLLAKKEFHIYRKIEFIKAHIKAKELEVAEKKFEEVIIASKKFNENIEEEMEIYGDILNKLKKYNEATAAYKSSKNKKYMNRIYMKLGDSFKRSKKFEDALENYFYSIYENSEYKSVQPKYIKLAKELKRNSDLESVIRIITENKNLPKEKIFSDLI